MKKIYLGESDFTKLRERDGLYVDKTERIYDMIQYSHYLFLSRPRRFGKSLLVSTLAALFEGKKELFKGLWIEDKWKWEAYPIIRLDFSKLEEGYALEDLDDSLVAIFEEYAELYDIKLRGKKPPTLFDSLISKLYQKTGKRVVILVDEYDSPITNHLSDINKAKRNRKYFRKIYQIIKAAKQAKTRGYWHPYLGTEKEIYRVVIGFLYKKKKKNGKEALSIDSHWKRITTEQD